MRNDEAASLPIAVRLTKPVDMYHIRIDAALNPGKPIERAFEISPLGIHPFELKIRRHVLDALDSLKIAQLLLPRFRSQGHQSDFELFAAEFSAERSRISPHAANGISRHQKPRSLGRRHGATPSP